MSWLSLLVVSMSLLTLLEPRKPKGSKGHIRAWECQDLDALFAWIGLRGPRQRWQHKLVSVELAGFLGLLRRCPSHEQQCPTARSRYISNAQLLKLHEAATFGFLNPWSEVPSLKRRGHRLPCNTESEWFQVFIWIGSWSWCSAGTRVATRGKKVWQEAA